MTVSEFIKKHGQEAGPEGIAIFAYLKDNPSATCAEAAKAIGMGKAALVRHALRLEELGLITRTVKKTTAGLILPATLSVADPIQNGRGKSDNTPSKLDSLSKMEPLPIQYPYQNGEVDSKGLSLSDPYQNGKGANGTKVAPYSAIRTSTDIPQPTVEGDANAPPPSRKSRKVIQHPSVKPESEHQRLMRELFVQTGPIPDGKAQGDAVKWLLQSGYTVEECLACLSEFLAELKDQSHWRTARVSWLTIKKEIGAWKLKGTDNEQAPSTGPARTQYGGRPPVTRDYSKFGSRT